MGQSANKSESEWKAILSPEQVRTAQKVQEGARLHDSFMQFRILREKGTEPAGTGKYEHFKGQGIYNCAGCGTPLYKSTTKFDSGCGWPAFFDGEPVPPLFAM